MKSQKSRAGSKILAIPLVSHASHLTAGQQKALWNMYLSHRIPGSWGRIIKYRADAGQGPERKQRDTCDSLSTCKASAAMGHVGLVHLSAALLLSDSATDEALNKARNKYSISASLVLSACACSAAEQHCLPSSTHYPNGSTIKTAKKTAPVTPLACAHITGAADLSDCTSRQGKSRRK